MKQHILSEYTGAVITVVVLVQVWEGLSVQSVVLGVIRDLILELDLRRGDINLCCLGAD
jgi:hypothetical protein